MTRHEMKGLTNLELESLVAQCRNHPIGERAESVLSERAELCESTPLTMQNAVAYVRSVFATSIDTVVGAELINEDGQDLILVNVLCNGHGAQAAVWMTDSGLYGEL